MSEHRSSSTLWPWCFFALGCWLVTELHNVARAIDRQSSLYLCVEEVKLGILCPTLRRQNESPSHEG